MNRSGLVRFVVFLTVILELSIFVRSTSRTGKQRPVLRSTAGSLRDILAEDSPLSNFTWRRKSRASKRSAVPKEGQLAVSETTASPQSTGWLEMTAKRSYMLHGVGYCKGKVSSESGREIVQLSYNAHGDTMACKVSSEPSSSPVVEFQLDAGTQDGELLFTGRLVVLVKDVSDWFFGASEEPVGPMVLPDDGLLWSFKGLDIEEEGGEENVKMKYHNVIVPRPKPRPDSTTSNHRRWMHSDAPTDAPKTQLILMRMGQHAKTYRSNSDRYPIYHCYTSKKLKKRDYTLGMTSQLPAEHGMYPPCVSSRNKKAVVEFNVLRIAWTSEDTRKLTSNEENELIAYILNHKKKTYRTARSCKLSHFGPPILTCSWDDSEGRDFQFST